MEQLLASPSLNLEDELYLRFALGKAYEDQSDYDRAFEYFEKANRLQRQSIEYRVEIDEDWANQIIAVFNGALIDRLTESGVASEQPIFIIGMPRSGSTLIEQVLASHSSVHGGGRAGCRRTIGTRLQGRPIRRLVIS